MSGPAWVVNTPSTGNTWLEGILWGTQWESGSGKTIVTTRIASEWVVVGGVWVPGFIPTEEQVSAMRRAMASFENVCNIDFQVVGNQASADLIWAMVDNSTLPGDLAGQADPPGTAAPFGEAQSVVAVDWQDLDWTAGSNMMSRGSFDYSLFLHELGHGVGLAHPHDIGGGSSVWPGVSSSSDLGSFNMNQGVFTMMSYNDGWATGPQGPSPSEAYGREMGPMAFDIAALQVMYGKNMSYRTGDGLYELPDTNEVGTGYACIWDAGGTDRIVGAAGRSNHIDLRAATLKFEKGGGGYLSYADGIHGGFTIAKGVTIERARGGRGSRLDPRQRCRKPARGPRRQRHPVGRQWQRQPVGRRGQRLGARRHRRGPALGRHGRRRFHLHQPTKQHLQQLRPHL